MRKLTLRSLWAHKRRLVATVTAVMLGIGFTSGILVFTDSLNKVFDDLFAEATADIDVVVQSTETIGSFGGPEQRGSLDPATADLVAAVDGVADSEPYVLLATWSASLLDSEGHALASTNGPPTLLESWGEPGSDLNPYELVDGVPPTTAGEIAINVGAAEEAGYEVGDTVRVVTLDGTEEFQLVGTFLFGTAKSSGGSVSLDFSLDEAQRLTGNVGRITNVVAVAEDGVSDTDLAERVAAALPASSAAEAITGAAYGEQIASGIQEGFGFFSTILSAFATLALVVGAFIIYNTFQILVAQRTRELALLRAVGASKAQVVRSVLLEAFVVGVVASVAGVVLGLGLATLVMGAFSGDDLPTSSLVVQPATIVSCLVRGTLITVVAAAIPAYRAIRVPPLAALRDVAVERSGPSKIRLAIGALLAVGSLLLLSPGLRGTDDTDAVPGVGLGFVLLLIAAIVLGPALAGPTARMFGVVLPRFRGITGRLAVENSARSPKRTAATAAALVIAVSLIGFITVLGASMRTSIDRTLSGGLRADLVASSLGGFGPPTGFSPALGEAVAGIDGVDAVSGFGFAPVRVELEGEDPIDSFALSFDPATIDSVLEPAVLEGQLSTITDTEVAIDKLFAEGNDLAMGDAMTVVGPGGSVTLTVAAITDDQLMNPFAIPADAYRVIVPEALDSMLMVDLADDADLGAAQSAVEAVYADQPNVRVLDREAFIGSTADQVTGFVNFIYVMLALSVIIALLGIANTLSLSIHERTREIGLLRAIGGAQEQVKSSFRWEAAIIAVIGTVVGLGIGLLGGVALVRSLTGFNLGFVAIPVKQLVVIVLGATVLGILASVLPSRRAARLDILQAIAHD